MMNVNRLLVVDDDNDICEMLRDLGESTGFSTQATVNPNEFKKLFSAFNPTLIMLDLSIGEQDGIEILRFLSQMSCKCPVILMSGQEKRVLATAFRLGAEYGLNMAHHLQKPLNINTLTEYIENLKATTSEINSETLKHAIENNELVLYYQPIVSMKTKKVVQLEALVRWQRPGTEMLIYPDQFISIMEENNLTHPLTLWVIEQGLKHMNNWPNELRKSIHLNISPVMLNDLNLPDQIVLLAKEYNIPPSQLCFEVTETAVMSQPTVAMDILTRLRVKGFSLSLDDFGTGYSSLVQLYRMPFQEIKIDKSFVMALEKDQECQAISHSIIQLGHSLKLEIVAEGVENKASWDILESYGCDKAQGYYISKAMPALEFESWEKEWESRS